MFKFSNAGLTIEAANWYNNRFETERLDWDELAEMVEKGISSEFRLGDNCYRNSEKIDVKIDSRYGRLYMEVYRETYPDMEDFSDEMVGKSWYSFQIFPDQKIILLD